MKKYFLFTLFLCFMQITAMAQLQNTQPTLMTPREHFGKELFSFRVYNFADMGDRSKSMAEFHFTLVNDVLNFIKINDNEYRSIYTLEVVIYNNRRETIAYQSLVDTVRVGWYHQTNDRTQVKHRLFRFSLPAGEYDYRIQLYDGEGQIIVERSDRMKLADFSAEKLQMSDVVFADELDCDSLRFRPNLRNRFRDEKSQFAVYFEIYPPQANDSLVIDYSVKNTVGAELIKGQLQRETLPKVSICMALRDRLKQPGEYLLDVSVRHGKRIVKSQQKFAILWGDLAIQGENISLAIEQLALIAKSDQIRQMREAPLEEKQRLYDAFWQQRDPTPDTPENELKQVFFERIDHANRHFTEPRSGQEGWRTDRGRVYIRNGPPDEIEKMPSEPNMPTAEIWYYRKLQRRYIFSDPQGIGEYRLVKVE